MNNKRLIAKIFNGKKPIMTIDRNMLSCEFGALDRGNLTDVVNWGIYTNRGSLSFIDRSGLFDNQNINSPEILGYIVKFYLAYNEDETIIATFKVKSATLNDETREVTIEVGSKLEELQYMYRDCVVYYPYRGIQELIGLGNEKGEEYTNLLYSVPFALRFGRDTDLIKRIRLGRAFFQKENVWSSLTKICQASMTRIIEDAEGNAEITGSFPNVNPIIVLPSNIIGIGNYGFVRAENPSIMVNKVELGQHLNNVKEEFTVNYTVNDDGEKNPISIYGGDFELIKKDQYLTSAKIVSSINTPYKIWGNYQYGDFGVVNVSGKRIVEHEAPSQGLLTKAEVEFPIGWVGNVVGEGLDSIEFSFEMEISDKNRELMYDYFYRVLSFIVEFEAWHFIEDGEEKKTISNESSQSSFSVMSNEIIDTECIVWDEEIEGASNPLWETILGEVNKRYSNGIECFEIECLFNDYYDANGNKVFDTNDLSTHFKKYDVIIPYVKKRGQIVPLRVNEDGKTPKKFRVIGISYSYDGLLKQKLSIQEDRYDVD